MCFAKWGRKTAWRMRALIPLPLACEASALPLELIPRQRIAPANIHTPHDLKLAHPTKCCHTRCNRTKCIHTLRGFVSSEAAAPCPRHRQENHLHCFNFYCVVVPTSSLPHIFHSTFTPCDCWCFDSLLACDCFFNLFALKRKGKRE